jgi:hypothetical protein
LDGQAHRKIIVPIDADGTTILAEIVSRGGEQEIAGGKIPSFSGAAEAISKIAKEMAAAIKSAAPSKATVEFGCELSLESGHLTTLIVNSSGSASLKITLEWDQG